MSIDAYFCLCCLSTNDLKNLFCENPEANYVDILDDLFSVKPVKEDYEFDSYICEECAKCLEDARKFKLQVQNTLHILQVNGLIKLSETDKHMLITKVSTEYASDLDEKYKADKMADVKLSDQGNEDIKYPNSIKLEQDAKLTIILEPEKRITVPRKKKKETAEKSEMQYEVTKDFKCTVCAVVLPNVYVYHTHMNRHFPNHICETCGKGFLTKKRLKRHMPSHIKGPFTCKDCDTEFSNYNTLNSHRQRKHKSIELYACPYCPARFGTLTRRARHLADTHDTRAAHRCHICHKRFLLAGNLSTHLRNKHLKVKRHFCVECGAGFYQKQELRGHVAAHTGRNEFQCALCPKSYPRKKALDVHMRTHRDDRRFCCELCGKKFLQKCTLMTHARTHKADAQKPL